MPFLRPRAWGLAVALGLMLLTVSPQAAQQPYIDRVIVTTTAEDLLAYFNVAQAFAQESVRQAVMAGLPTTFTYFVELEEVRSFRADRLLASFQLKRTIKLDTLSEVFTITNGGNPNSVVTTSDWEEAQNLMTDVSGLRVISLAALEPSRTYRLRLRAQILKPELPLGLKIFFFWVPLGDIETEAYEVEFRRKK